MKQYTGIKKCEDGPDDISWKKCKCGSNLIINVGDCIRDGEFHWFASMQCIDCGVSIGVDGRGVLDFPCSVKQEIISRDGEWGLFAGCSKSKVSFLLKKILHEQSDNGNENGNVVYTGTKTQVQWLMYKLIEKGIDQEDLEERPLFL